MLKTKIYLLICLLSISLSAQAKKSFMLGGYITYWNAENSVNTTKKYVHLFDQISLFSFEVKPDGTIKDTFKRKKVLFGAFRDYCKHHKKLFVPTIYWTDTQDMHNVLSNVTKRNYHINQILETVLKNQFDGININYERVCSHDRLSYLTFIQKLSNELHKRGLVLHTSIGGRTSDNTIAIMQPGYIKHIKKHGHTDLIKHHLKHQKKSHVSLNPGKGADAAYYKKILGQCFDQVNFMVYDEWGKPYKYSKEAFKNKYYVSHSSNQWCEQVIQYALSFLPAHKVVIALPTYGLEFKVMPNGKDDVHLKKTRNIFYPTAQELIHIRNIKPQRTLGGELAFCYKIAGEERYMCYLDAQAIKDKIALAKRYRIKGISLFRVSGKEDEKMWPMIEKELLYSSLL